MQREPIALVQAKGKKHLTKAEIESRLNQEVKVAPAVNFSPPTFLEGSALKKEFRVLAKALAGANLFTDLDRDLLGYYLQYKERWISLGKQVDEAIMAGDIAEFEFWQNQQAKAFDQCRKCGADLGLSVTARCKLVLPSSAKPQEAEDPFLKMLSARQGGM